MMRSKIGNGFEIDFRSLAQTFGLVLLLVLVGVFVTILIPGLVGADASYVVLSDSMSPTINAGGVVFVAEVSPSEVSTGDVITYRQSGADNENIVTHRVTEVIERDGVRRFQTKGDANEEPDSQLVRPNQLRGKVAFSVPLVGYVVSFAKSALGLVVLVLIPATILVALEVRDLLVEIEEEAHETTEDGGGEA